MPTADEADTSQVAAGAEASPMLNKDAAEAKSGHVVPAELVAERDAQLAARREKFEQDQEAAREKFDREEAAARERFEQAAQKMVEASQRDAARRAAEEDNMRLARAVGILSDADRSAPDNLAPHDGSVLPHEALAPNGTTVKMAFPRQVILTRNEVPTRVLFRKGIHDVPDYLAGHDYLAASGAYVVDGDGKPLS